MQRKKSTLQIGEIRKKRMIVKTPSLSWKKNKGHKTIRQAKEKLHYRRFEIVLKARDKFLSYTLKSQVKV